MWLPYIYDMLFVFWNSLLCKFWRFIRNRWLNCGLATEQPSFLADIPIPAGEIKLNYVYWKNSCHWINPTPWRSDHLFHLLVLKSGLFWVQYLSWRWTNPNFRGEIPSVFVVRSLVLLDKSPVFLKGKNSHCWLPAWSNHLPPPASRNFTSARWGERWVL